MLAVSCGPAPLRAQSPAQPSPAQPSPASPSTPNLAELRQIIALRDLRQSGAPQQIAAAAQAYLKRFSTGRYRDEALLALGDALLAQHEEAQALAAYERLITDHPDSPFRDQAMVKTLPLLQNQGQQKQAFARVDALLRAYPLSVHRDQALLWKAGVLFQAGDYPGTVATLKRVKTPENLPDAEQTAFYRMRAMALLNANQPAQTAVSQYLKSQDTPEHKAGLLMLAGALARKNQRWEEGLKYYQTVVERYPLPAHLSEALYWRADLFRHAQLDTAQGEVRRVRLPEAIGYLTAYLETGDTTHAPEALIQRAELFQEAGRKAEALSDYERAVTLKPALAGDSQILMARVALNTGLKRNDKAIALLDAAQKDTAFSAEARNRFRLEEAALYYKAEQCEQVEQLLNPMPIYTDPANRSRAAFVRGFCRWRRGEWEKASFDLEGLINDPAYQDLVLEPLLDAYAQSKQYSRLVHLVEELLRAGRVQPSEPLLISLANAYDKLGEQRLMVSAYTRLEALNPKAVQTPEIQYRLGEAEEALGKPDQAAAHYLAVLKLWEQQPAEDRAQPPPSVFFSATEHLTLLYVTQGKDSDLDALLARAGKSVGNDPDAQARLKGIQRDADLARGRRELKNGHAAQAVTHLEAAWKRTGPGEKEKRIAVLALLVPAYEQAGKPDQGLALYRTELKADDEAYRTQLTLAVLAPMLAQPLPSDNKDERARSIAFYRQAFGSLPPEDFSNRYKVARKLDQLYQAQGDFGARAALIATLLKDGADPRTKKELRQYQVQIYKDWGLNALRGGKPDEALFNLRRALELVDEKDWRQRYALVAEISKVLLQNQRYTDLVLLNEDVLPQIEDPALAAQVRHFLGQVYLEWGKAADAEKNPKSASIRYARALDYLPDTDWQRRLAAAAGLAAVRKQEGKPQEAAAVYEKVMPQVPAGKVRQRYALYLGRLYWEALHDARHARTWLKDADDGTNDPLSLEAGYLLAGVEQADKRPDVALKVLKNLIARNLKRSKWRVPIHYRLAVLYHQRKALKQALAQYRIVANEKSADLRRLYSRPIAQSRKMVAEIQAYLRVTGGKNGANVAVPKVNGD